jgi:hypothetical protein
MATMGANKSAPKKSPTKEGAASSHATTAEKRKPKFGPAVGEHVEDALHELKEGALKSGRSGKKVTNRKQAIAIGISEARREGARAPEKPDTR